MSTWVTGPNELDPVSDAKRLADAGIQKNYAKVGAGRPSSLLYTYGPGAIMDLPHFTVMPSGLDAWERIWRRRVRPPHIHAPKLLDAVRRQLGQQVRELRPFPHQPEESSFGDEGRDLGVPALVFPQWLRCTGCERLAPLNTFRYRNTHPYRPDEARFEHHGCPGFGKSAKGGGNKRSLALPARYLLACTNGHLDEFPYDEWVHRGQQCKAADFPVLKMNESTISRGASATILCASCGEKRGMNEAQGDAGKSKLPACRGRFPHLDAYDPEPCTAGSTLMLVGASNLWFPILQSVIVMPMDASERKQNLTDRLRAILGDDLAIYLDAAPKIVRNYLEDKLDVSDLTDEALTLALHDAAAPASEPDDAPAEPWSPIDLLAPEWSYLQTGVGGDHHEDEASGLTLSARDRDDALPHQISRVLAVESLRQATALLGFTRIDDLDRIDDEPRRHVPLSLEPPSWVVANLNRGEGIFLELAEDAVASWEKRVEASALWRLHQEAHRRNFGNRLSATATMLDADTRFQPPRYWLLHTFAHVLFREMAMRSGYGAASISERIYAWQKTDKHDPAAGVLLLTTSSDSDGTLGGLVALSEPDNLRRMVAAALHRAERCSSDPVCARRTPRFSEEFLHGAACHCCTMASETSCERANRFLDRRFLINLPGDEESLGFFEVEG